MLGYGDDECASLPAPMDEVESDAGLDLRSLPNVTVSLKDEGVRGGGERTLGSSLRPLACGESIAGQSDLSCGRERPAFGSMCDRMAAASSICTC